MSREMEQGEGAGSDPIYVTQTQHLALQRATREALGRLEERMDAKLTNLEERLDNNFECHLARRRVQADSVPIRAQPDRGSVLG